MKKIFQFDQDEIDSIVQTLVDARKCLEGNSPIKIDGASACIDMAIHLLITDNADKPEAYDH